MRTAPIDRREFLAGAAALGAAWPVAGLTSRAQAEPAGLVARRVFFDNPDCTNVRVSPDGLQIAYVAPVDGVNNLWVAPADDPAAARPLTRVTDRNISGYFRWAYTSRHLVFFRERDGDENWRAASVNIGNGTIVSLTPEVGVKSFLQEVDRKYPEEMLIRHNQRDKSRFDLFWVNVVTGVSERIFENTEYAELFTDSHFQLRLAMRLKADGTAEWLERLPDRTWVPFTEVPIGDIDSFRLLDLSADGATLYLIDSRGRDKAALFALDMKTRDTTLLAEDDEADIVQVALDEERRPVAAKANRDRARWYAVDAGARQDLADLARHGDGDVNILSDSADRRMASVLYERDNASGEFALLDRERREVRKLLVQRKALADIPLRKMQPVIIPSRDGLRLNGYLTLPAQDAGSRMPLVLVIHGGPYARDF